LRRGAPGDVPTAVAIDDAAFMLYRDVGIAVDFAADHPLVLAEEAAWRRCAAGGGLFFAITQTGVPVGFAAVGAIDGAAHLEQIAVLPAHMRRGIGRLLMDRAAVIARDHGHEAILLTTYDHVPWNRPYYAALGFEVVPEADWGPGIAATIAHQRAYLPMPARRIAMRKTL